MNTTGTKIHGMNNTFLSIDQTILHILKNVLDVYIISGITISYSIKRSCCKGQLDLGESNVGRQVSCNSMV